MTDPTTAMTTTKPAEDTSLEKISDYLERKEIQARFAAILGERGAHGYISSILIAVAGSESLRKCNRQSIYIQALRAATLRMSVDPSLGQAYLVPYKGQATLIVGYKGLYDMAMRTGKYRWINVGPVYQGEEPVQDRMSGNWTYGTAPPTSMEIIGWLAAFLKFDGTSKTLYMSHEEIHAHAKRYSQSYDTKGGVWEKETLKMERKTCLRTLLRLWGELTPDDQAVLDEIEEERPEPIEAQFNELAAETEQRTQAPEFNGKASGIMQLGFETANPDPVRAETMTAWAALLMRAEKVKVPMQQLNMNTVTDADLREHMAEVSRFVVDAEQQAGAV